MHKTHKIRKENETMKIMIKQNIPNLNVFSFCVVISNHMQPGCTLYVTNWYNGQSFYLVIIISTNDETRSLESAMNPIET